MVYSFRVVAVVPCLVFQPVPSIATAIKSLPQSESGIAPALLNTTLVERNNVFITRADCSPGWDACTNGVPGCCPSSMICALLQGNTTCCSVGQPCVIHTSPQCVDTGYVLCPGTDGFCCPQNDTCSQDASGHPTCASGPGGGVTVTLISASTPPFSQPTSPPYDGPGVTLGDNNAPTNTIAGFSLFAVLTSMISILITI